MVNEQQQRSKYGFALVTTSVEFSTAGGTPTAYSANDRVAPADHSLVEIPNCAKFNGRGGVISMIRLTTDKKSITPRFRIHFFNTTGATLPNDNATWYEKYADISKRVGYYDMTGMTTAADTTNSDMSRAEDQLVRMPFTCASTSTSLWFSLETLDAFTQAASEKFTLVLKIEQS